ncbi:DUF4244 domain-containing protein [Isoptericola sp. NEAU-Y5]|uniref:DUF4244 domain-containing protein n=1 Tax=Isoptericola luteus TaxID=2879484 RepID=A0ABS7ZAU3_9MICO|nr:DUF4244 domain-containing protein [Isoptericola sp. NEAU-Y5]MCA5892140.1 DUF4244 domain-containing protein [Isoptericola sp. NEAU-Y5]
MQQTMQETTRESSRPVPAGPAEETVPEELDPEAGLATAEYAVATVAAVGFAGLLIALLKSETVRGLLENIITSALSI